MKSVDQIIKKEIKDSVKKFITETGSDNNIRELLFEHYWELSWTYYQDYQEYRDKYDKNRR